MSPPFIIIIRRPDEEPYHLNLIGFAVTGGMCHRFCQSQRD